MRVIRFVPQIHRMFDGWYFQFYQRIFFKQQPLKKIGNSNGNAQFFYMYRSAVEFLEHTQNKSPVSVKLLENAGFSY